MGKCKLCNGTGKHLKGGACHGCRGSGESSPPKRMKKDYEVIFNQQRIDVIYDTTYAAAKRQAKKLYPGSVIRRRR